MPSLDSANIPTEPGILSSPTQIPVPPPSPSHGLLLSLAIECGQQIIQSSSSVLRRSIESSSFLTIFDAIHNVTNEWIHSARFILARRIIENYQYGTPLSINTVFIYLNGMVDPLTVPSNPNHESVPLRPSNSLIMIDRIATIDKHILHILHQQHGNTRASSSSSCHPLSLSLNSLGLTALDGIGKNMLHSLLSFLPSPGKNSSSSSSTNEINGSNDNTATSLSSSSHVYQDYIVIVRSFLRHLAQLDIQQRYYSSSLSNVVSTFTSRIVPSFTAILYTRTVQSMLATVLSYMEQYYQSFILQKHTIGNPAIVSEQATSTKKKRPRGTKGANLHDASDHPFISSMFDNHSIHRTIEQGFLFVPSSNTVSTESLSLPHRLLTIESSVPTRTNDDPRPGEKIIHGLFLISLLISDVSTLVTRYHDELQTNFDTTYILRSLTTGTGTNASVSSSKSLLTLMHYLSNDVAVPFDSLTNEEGEIHYRIMEGVNSIRTLLQSLGN